MGFLGLLGRENGIVLDFAKGPDRKGIFSKIHYAKHHAPLANGSRAA